ncbi:SDR family oxidoreductase [Povalibacter sp.]|uniref:SDR family NAD(P)-dependent oxidoreductase n=1 Tax=Povalibacter sp. TaxID=1962978 RepID=UPI002F42339B
MSEFRDRIAVVTGGAHGIGASVVRGLAGEGARVHILDLDAQAASSLAAEVDGVAHCVDARDASALQRAFVAIDREEPGIDVLVSNVGGGARRTLENMSVEDWDEAMALNLRSAFIATREVLPGMRRRGGGSIVNVSSIAAHSVSPVSGAAYAAAKAGLLALTRQTAFEWAAQRIRANAVCPGPTRTALTHNSLRSDADFPLGRWTEAGDVAAAILFLASSRASMCSGTVMTVDGAFSLRT